MYKDQHIIFCKYLEILVVNYSITYHKMIQIDNECQCTLTLGLIGSMKVIDDDEVGLKEKPEDTRYIKIIHQNETQRTTSVGKLNILDLMPTLCPHWCKLLDWRPLIMLMWPNQWHSCCLKWTCSLMTIWKEAKENTHSWMGKYKLEQKRRLLCKLYIIYIYIYIPYPRGLMPRAFKLGKVLEWGVGVNPGGRLRGGGGRLIL